MTTYVNRQLKKNMVGCGVSIPVTQYYIKEYLAHISSSCVNRFEFISKKKNRPMSDIFKLERENRDIIDNMIITTKKVITYVEEQKDKKVDENGDNENDGEESENEKPV